MIIDINNIQTELYIVHTYNSIQENGDVSPES